MAVTRLRTLCWRGLIPRTGTVPVVSQFVGRPAIRLRGTGLLDLLFVAFGCCSLDAVGQRFRSPSLFKLATSRLFGVDIARLAVDADVFQLLRQRPLLILWIVTRLVLPLVADVASDRPAVVVGEATDAADLSIVFGIMSDDGRMKTLVMRSGQSTVADEVVSVDSRDRERGVCHAILSVGERVWVRW